MRFIHLPLWHFFRSQILQEVLLFTFQDTAHEQSTQCFQDGNNVMYVSAATDYTITPGKYQTYAQKMRRENKLAKIILIQRNFRRFLIVRFMRNAAAKYR